MNSVIVIGLCSIVLFAHTANAGIEAHEHGITWVTLTKDDGAWKVDLELPMENVVGSENCPNSPEQNKKQMRAAEIFRNAESIFEWPSAAKCTVFGFKKESELFAKPCTHPEGNHEDLIVTFLLKCSEPQKMSFLGFHDSTLPRSIHKIRYRIAEAAQTFVGEMKSSSLKIHLP